MFLTSQLEYLRGLDCCGAPSGAASGARANDTTREHMDRACETPIELHILCQERYDDDWRRLLETFGLRSQQMSRVWHSHVRNVSTSRNLHRTGRGAARARALEAELTSQSILKESDLDFIRRELFPWDTTLHSWSCGGAPTNSVRFADAAP
jgi:hypothetical protein